MIRCILKRFLAISIVIILCFPFPVFASASAGAGSAIGEGDSGGGGSGLGGLIDITGVEVSLGNFWEVFHQSGIEFSNFTWNLIRHLVDQDICWRSVQPDGHHKFTEMYTQVDGKLGYYYICEYCGKSAGEVAKEAYDEHVETLPYSVVSDGGAFVVKMEHDYFVFYRAGGYSVYCNHASSGGSSDLLDFSCSTNVFTIKPSVGYSAFSSMGRVSGFLTAVAPVEGGYYFPDNPVSVDYVAVWSDGTTTRERYTASMKILDESFYYRAGDTISQSFTIGCPKTDGSRSLLCLQGTFNIPDLVYITPTSGPYAVTNNTGNDYAMDTRAASLEGTFGIINGDGNIQSVNSTSIVNETNNTVYNPVTNTTRNITNWDYDYTDRSYNLTTEEGDNIKVTYGDENVVIVEPGGTYNVYYLVESGSVPSPSSLARIASGNPAIFTDGAANVPVQELIVDIP